MTTEKDPLFDAGDVFRSLGLGPLTFGEMLRSLRECAVETQVQYAERLGIHKQELSGLETGRIPITLKRALGFADRIGHSRVVLARIALEEMARREGIELEVSFSEETLRKESRARAQRLAQAKAASKAEAQAEARAEARKDARTEERKAAKRGAKKAPILKRA